MLPKVGIVILNWNGYVDTVECLESLRAITYPSYEIIVIDNGSSGNDVQLLEEKFGGSIQLLANPENLGFAGGCNVGIHQALNAGSDYVLLLNNDIVVDSAFLEEMVRGAESLAGSAAFCPKIYFYGQPNVICSTGGRVFPWTGRARQIGRGEEDRGQYDEPEERDYADGACMLIRRDALEKVGLLDEEYFAYWEETDWCERARSMGFECYYLPAARVWHKTARSQKPDSRYYYLFRRNALLFLAKRKTKAHLVTAVAYTSVLGAAHLLRHPSAVRRLPGEARAFFWHLSGRFRKRKAV